jgi:hypothetical protein
MNSREFAVQRCGPNHVYVKVVVASRPISVPCIVQFPTTLRRVEAVLFRRIVFVEDVFDLGRSGPRTWETRVTEVTQCTDGLIALDRGFENNKSEGSGI